MNKLRLALPKGSLEKPTLELFKRVGYRLETQSRRYVH